MKGTSVFLDHVLDRRVAVRMVDGRVEDLLVDPPEGGPNVPGTVFLAKVGRQMKGQGGVFVQLPHGQGFLRQAKGLAQGQSVLVQVTGYAEPGKAVPVTLKLLFKSRFAIVTPDAPGLNVSRRIRDEDARAALKSLAEDLMDGSEFGLILRSEAEGADEGEIAEDIAEMRSLAEAILGESSGDPQLLLEGADSHALAWRDWGTPDEIVTDAGCLETRGVLDDLSLALSGDIPLTGGGSLVVEPTRALVAVDVNTGGDQSPAAALKANIEAARELPRALRLRGLGGQIVVDFAPLAKKDRRQIEQVLKSTLRADPVETAMIGWTPLGHFELQRKRERPPLDPTVTEALR
ncbi:Rne/Rng family ribonuclease [Aliiruegeria haliotis]|uniref:Rne/Rng family ribonuclease n=1 Tax=Aliiruegeria haliotis TaxID=1280846 RepID=A0A2T0RPN7_9RHOB|nr:ribonuclease E/G [Aliiruegeria haliotis]PRY23149.1 Rne/Rng family ribonuclease [Aliiruegeria haliotis]